MLHIDHLEEREKKVSAFDSYKQRPFEESVQSSFSCPFHQDCLANVLVTPQQLSRSQWLPVCALNHSQDMEQSENLEAERADCVFKTNDKFEKFPVSLNQEL